MTIRRRYIPLKIRCLVLAQQIYESGHNVPCREEGEALSALVARWRKFLFGDKPNELHHRPALINRPWNKRKRDYDPPANDSAHLVYLPKHDHKIETLVRGVGAQLSDFAQRRKNKRMARNRDPKRRPKAKIAARKQPWPKRKFRSAR
jgi:hypothetical protein